ncbi:hypothetical protein G4H72_05535 [Rhodococcus triatomae]|nr:hypothetical protein [Rhodococcus triatomae]QNG18270.1 hypothetical protein G4H72_05535 [Rhodococcus triatomae]
MPQIADLVIATAEIDHSLSLSIARARQVIGESLSEDVKRAGSIDRFLDELDSVDTKTAAGK